MIAYVFWHAPQPLVDSAAYEAQLLRFHEALAAMSIAGYLRSRSFAVDGLPWLGHPRGYEDWYVLADSGALDRLNDAAVRHAAQPPHDRLAAQALFGAGGVYRHRRGDPDDPSLDASWFSKPAGMTYLQLFELVGHSGGSLWQRQMVLGPGREFCLHGAASDLPTALDVLRLRRRRIEIAR